MYKILPLGDDFVELCDECGFNGALIDMDEAAVRLRGLRARWSSVFSLSEELVRARPAPETWCSVEYAQHVAYAIGAIEWGAGQFLLGVSPDWSKEPTDLAGQFEHGAHQCDRFSLGRTLEILGSAATSLAALAIGLKPEELSRQAEYVDGLVINTAAVVRHALHDAEHHVLDIGRGIARIQLSSG
jgi:hypothetical protein